MSGVGNSEIAAAAILTAAELERYARQIGPGVLTVAEQQRLKQSRVFVTRAGGMGGPAAQALVMAGVGRVIIAHGGPLISADLNRQVLGAEAHLGEPRAEPFAARLRALNRFVVVEAVDHEPDDAEALAWAQSCDLLLSCAPSFAERLRLNRAAVTSGKPLIDAAQWGMTGTLMVLRPGHTPCLECVYPEPPLFEELFPVVGAISSTIGAMAALECVKILAGVGRPMWGRLWSYDGWQGLARDIHLRRNPHCACCGHLPDLSADTSRMTTRDGGADAPC